jgi:hypothetical protein
MADSNSILATNVVRVWNRLATVRQLTFESRSSSVEASGWEGQGTGQVVVDLGEPATLLFHETGTWRSAEGRQFRFSNAYRWTLDDAHQRLRLEHLRFGRARPVLLFDLAALNDGVLQSDAAHVCSDDCYTARLELDADTIHLDWKIVGPKKDEAISYRYQ